MIRCEAQDHDKSVQLSAARGHLTAGNPQAFRSSHYRHGSDMSDMKFLDQMILPNIKS